MVAKDFKIAPRGSLGTHVVVEFVGCDPALLENEQYLKRHAQEACLLAGATVLGTHSHKFEPQGTTVLVLLAESHLSVHTWPEFGYVALDVFTCGEGLKPEEAVHYLAERLKPRNYWLLELKRGCHSKLDGKVAFKPPILLISGPREVKGPAETEEKKRSRETTSRFALEASSDPTS